MEKLLSLTLRSSKLIAFLLLLGYSQATLAVSGETDKKKKDNPKHKILEKQIASLLKTDSLKTSRTSFNKKDSIVDKQKEKAPTGASYNILFQVIYRNSFSDIFEVNN